MQLKHLVMKLRGLGMGSINGGEWQSKEFLLLSLSLSRSLPHVSSKERMRFLHAFCPLFSERRAQSVPDWTRKSVPIDLQI